MNIYYDTEFLEDGATISLISIGMVAEDGREYYAINHDAPWERISKHTWLMSNVVPGLPLRTKLPARSAFGGGYDSTYIDRDKQIRHTGRSGLSLTRYGHSFSVLLIPHSGHGTLLMIMWLSVSCGEL